MSSRTFTITAGAMVAVALAVRVYNALTFPPLLGYDGFGHFTYVWYVAATGRVPLATSGWSFFHPPLYYALMAALWKALSGVDALTRLAAGSVIMGVLSLTHALVSYLIVRRFFPGDRLLHVLAPGLTLFLPVHIYSAPFIGNEGLTAVLCSLAILALLGVMWRPSALRCIMLGVCLGLAMLTKFTAVGIVGGACAAIGLKSVVERDFKNGLRRLAVVGAVMLAICGWYYVRNVRVYGTPFKLSREEFMVRQVENSQPQAMRGFLEYVLFDPMIFRRPEWPRGFTVTDDTIPGGRLRSLRESVWTGVYATTWLDGGWMLPSVAESARTRHAGQILLTLGLVPTSLVILGLWTAIRRLWRDGWDDTIGALLLCFLAIVALFIEATHAVPIPAAVKASYLMPATVPFSFWFALGLERLTKHAPRVRPYVVAECVTLAAVSVAVFTYGLLIPRRTLNPAFLAYNDNVTGITYYAAGERAAARAWFVSAAVDGSYVAHENLAALELEAGRPREARHFLKRAMRLEPGQSFGRPDDRAHLDRITRAEYLNSLAVIEQTLGRSARAVEAARAALRLDATIPEAHYNLGVLELLEARAPGAASPAAAALTRDAASRFARALAVDPAFVEAGTALGAARALAGDCTAARRTLDEALTVRAGLRREFPAETGRGIGYAPAIGRRKRIDARAAGLVPEAIVAACNASGDHGAAADGADAVLQDAIPSLVAGGGHR
jgi:tetratricopeptide (TPR) repeat protein